MIYYFLLVAATLLFALSFLLNKRVEKNTKNTFDTTVLFMTLTWVEIFVVLFILLKGKLDFTYFSVICAVIHSCCLTVYTILNLKILKTVGLAKYSLYTMLGGMLIPTFYGIIFAKEPLTMGKVICCLLVSLSLLYDSGSEKTRKSELKFLLSVFFVNGLFGVISAIHQNSTISHVGSLEYMSLQAIIISVIGAVWLAVKKLRTRKIDAIKSKKAYLDMLGYGVLYGSAELILLLAIKHIPSSVQYPIITGGTMIFSTIISAAIGESRSKKSIISLAMALVALIFLIW